MAKRDEDGLLPVQRRFIRAFIHDPACKRSVVAAAKKVGRSYKRFYDWLKEDDFKKALDQERDMFRLSHGPAVDDAMVRRASSLEGNAADRRLWYERVGELEGKATPTVNTMNVQIVSREDAIRVIEATIRALKLHGDKKMAALLAEEHDVIPTEFEVLATT